MLSYIGIYTENVGSMHLENCMAFRLKGYNIVTCISDYGTLGIVVVKALCYMPEVRQFEKRWGKSIFSIYLILLATLHPGVYSASNRNEYHKQKSNVSGE
jgi:hypothetical protein